MSAALPLKGTALSIPPAKGAVAGGRPFAYKMMLSVEVTKHDDGSVKSVRIGKSAWRALEAEEHGQGRHGIEAEDNAVGAHERENEEEAWFARALPPSARRSGDARIRECMIRKRHAFEEAVDEALWDVQIEIGWLAERTASEDGAALDGLARQCTDTVVAALYDTADAEGGLGCSEAQAHAAWEEGARAHAYAWLEGHADARVWERLIRSITGAGAEMSDRSSGGQRAQRQLVRGATAVGAERVDTLPMTRLVELAGRGDALAEALEKADPWVVREVCQGLWSQGLWSQALDDNPALWPARAVQQQAQLLGRPEVSDADADAALAHWRWPQVRPPMTIVAGGAGRLTPIESDSGWAHALAVEGLAHWDKGDAWWKKARTGEALAGSAVAEKVRAIAGEMVEAAGEEQKRASARPVPARLGPKRRARGQRRARTGPARVHPGERATHDDVGVRRARARSAARGRGARRRRHRACNGEGRRRRSDARGERAPERTRRAADERRRRGA